MIRTAPTQSIVGHAGFRRSTRRFAARANGRQRGPPRPAVASAVAGRFRHRPDERRRRRDREVASGRWIRTCPLGLTRSHLAAGSRRRARRNRALAREHCGQRFQPGGPLAFLPLADGRCSIVWSLPEAEATRILALDDAAFRVELGCAFDFRLCAITATTPRAAFPLRLRLAEKYVVGRCVLAGDAAHLVHPLAGQGMNLGFRDVTCLRRALGYARERGSDIGAAHVLRRYERERRGENALAARGLDVIEQVFGSGVIPLATMRGLGFAALDRLGPLKHLFTDAAAGRL